MWDVFMDHMSPRMLVSWCRLYGVLFRQWSCNGKELKATEALHVLVRVGIGNASGQAGLK